MKFTNERMNERMNEYSGTYVRSRSAVQYSTTKTIAMGIDHSIPLYKLEMCLVSVLLSCSEYRLNIFFLCDLHNFCCFVPGTFVFSRSRGLATTCRGIHSSFDNKMLYSIILYNL